MAFFFLGCQYIEQLFAWIRKLKSNCILKLEQIILILMLTLPRLTLHRVYCLVQKERGSRIAARRSLSKTDVKSSSSNLQIIVKRFYYVE